MNLTLPYQVSAGKPRSSSQIDANYAAAVAYFNAGLSGTADAGIQQDSFGLNTSQFTFSLTGQLGIDATYAATMTNNLMSLVGSAALGGPMVAITQSGTAGLAALRLAGSGGGAALSVTQVGAGPGLRAAVTAGANGIARTGSNSTPPLIVASALGGARYGAYATGSLPALADGSVTYDTTTDTLKLRSGGAWANANAAWVDSTLGVSGRTAAVTVAFTTAKWAPRVAGAGSGTIPTNSTTNYPLSASCSVIYNKLGANTVLLVSPSGALEAGSGSTTSPSITLGLHVNGTLAAEWSYDDVASVASGNNPLVKAWYVPLTGIGAGNVTIDLRIRQTRASAGTTYYNGSFEVREL